MPKVVLLDIDGTLLDSNEAHARAWAAALHEYGHVVPVEVLRPLIGKGGDKLLLETVELDIHSEGGQLIDKARQAIFNEQLLPTLHATEGARALLVRLRDSGLQLVVATSASDEDLKGLLKQGGLEDLLEVAATSSDSRQSKPAPDIVQAALRKAGVQPDEAVMLGDTPYDIRAASASGVRTIALRCGGWWNDEAFADAVAVYNDPADLLLQFDSSVLNGL
jgi:HAD superfamily hydrolase (TIGR01509 family)